MSERLRMGLSAAFVVLVAIACFLILVGVLHIKESIRERGERFEREWEGARLVRVCNSRDHVYLLRDGTHRIRRLDAVVEGPGVCDMIRSDR